MGLTAERLKASLDALAGIEPAIASALARIGYPEPRIRGRGFEVPGFFRHLAYVVVDELHAFLGTERGRQLQSLLARLELAIGRRVPRIALSATLGDMGLAREFLRPGESESVLAVIARESSQQLQLQVRGYRELPPRLAPKDARNLEAQGRPIETEDVTPGDQLAISEHLFATLRGGHHLVFANARSSVETYADLLRRRCERERVPEEFWPHHGSLSKELREHAEERLKDPRRPATLVATTTLELGIDVGSVGSIAQIGVPPSVASMRQRLGRSGRQSGPAVLRVYLQEPEVTARSSPLEVLRARLIQTVAMVELLLERWVEPPHPAALHLSTLVQQVLSSIAQHGGLTAPQAYHALCRQGPFGSVSPERFIALLRSLGEHDLITQTHDGELVLGLTGERLTGHFDFYAAFTSPEEFRLVSGGKTLGTLPISDPLYPGAYVVFGGNRWRVLAVDDRRKVVDLAPARGGRVPRVSGDAPGGVHDRVRRRMADIYRSDNLPPFLDAAARDLLTEGREGYERYRVAEVPFVVDGRDTWWIALRGDRILDTLALAARTHGAECRRVGPALQFDELPPEAARRLLADLAASPPPDPLALAAVVENKRTEKLHPFLSDELLTADYAARALDVEGAWEALADWADRTPV